MNLLPVEASAMELDGNLCQKYYTTVYTKMFKTHGYDVRIVPFDLERSIKNHLQEVLSANNTTNGNGPRRDVL